MNNKETILKEIESIAPTVVEVGNTLPYVVPVNYFTDFPSTILVAVQENSVFNLPKVEINYTVPEDYFNSLSTNILAKIQNENTHSEVKEELQTIAPTLLQINKVNVYAVPANYFNTLPAGQFASKKAKIVSLQNWFSWRTMAVAASFVAVLFTGNYVYNNYQTRNQFEAYKKVDINKSILTASDDDLLQFLTTEPTNANLDIAAVENELDIAEPQQKIETSTDEELNEYLKEIDHLALPKKES